MDMTDLLNPYSVSTHFITDCCPGIVLATAVEFARHTFRRQSIFKSRNNIVCQSIMDCVNFGLGLTNWILNPRNFFHFGNLLLVAQRNSNRS